MIVTDEKREKIIELWAKFKHGTKGTVRRKLVDAINQSEGTHVLTYGTAKAHWFADDYQISKKWQDFVIDFFENEIQKQNEQTT